MRLRSRWLVLLVLFGLLASVAPATAKITLIDASEDPPLLLDEDSALRLAALQSSRFPQLVSNISPDDRTVVQFDGDVVSFLNILDGTQVNLSDDIFNYPVFTNLAWRDANTAVYISGDENGALLVGFNRNSGEVVTSTLELPGFPISLAPNASRALVALIIDDEAEQQAVGKPLVSPFTREVKAGHPPLAADVRRGKHADWAKKDDTLRIAEISIVFASFDLNTKKLVPLTILLPDSGLVSEPKWTPDGSKLAYVRTTIPNVGRAGNLLSEFTTQDGLGQIAPSDNPFFVNNVVDAFDIAGNDLRPEALLAVEGNGDIFADASWSTDGKTLMTHVQRPAKLTGRTYPIYQFPDRSYLRFYNASFELIKTFDPRQIDAPRATTPMWLSGSEVVINAPFGLSYRLYYYNYVSGEFRQISVEEGTYYQMAATRNSKQLVFNMSSFQRPPELYRIQWDGKAFAGLTYVNAAVRDLNAVRVDHVSFTVASGAKRHGYLVQPADASFPPRNVPIVVWQEGGPGGTITNQWGGNVENPYNLLPNFGIAVLVLPLQGREGWGPQFYNDLANGRNFGQIDIDEGAQIVKQMIRRGYTTADQIGITGCSYGGYFTSQSITRHPGLYAAANTQCTLLDLYNEWQFGFTGFLSYLVGRAPTVDPNEYTKDSPLYNVTKNTTPLLIFHGTEDFLPVQLAANFHDQIEADGVPVEFLVFLGEGHGLSAPVNQFTAGQAQVLWFSTYLSGE